MTLPPPCPACRRGYRATRPQRRPAPNELCRDHRELAIQIGWLNDWNASVQRAHRSPLRAALREQTPAKRKAALARIAQEGG